MQPTLKNTPHPPAATSINPATGAFIRSYPYLDSHAQNSLLENAALGFREWRGFDLAQRRTVLQKMASVLRHHTERYATSITQEMGKPIVDARAEIEKCANLCEWYAQHGAAMLADEPAEIGNQGTAYVSYLPLGTILGVMPWNFPFWQVMRAAVPILFGGNGFLLKHASNVTGCALLIEEAWHQAGIPNGAFRLMHCASSDIAALIDDPRIAGVTLTGSMKAGASVAAAAGKALKKSVLELGGADPFIVLADADIAHAVNAGVKARFGNAGQVCIAAKRFILEKPIAAAFTEQFIEQAKTLHIGDPMKETTTLGPLARADLRDELDAQVKQTLKQGAKLLLGGHAIEGAGCFYAPTVLGDVVPGMAAFEEETFGPVASLTVADDAAHALQLANQSNYGLSGNLWCGDVQRAQAFARRMETGAVFINGFSASDPRVPIGGVKQSGYGRELSHFGLHAFLNAQTVWIRS